MKRFGLIALLAIACLGTSVHSANAIGVFASWWDANDADDKGFGGGIRSKTQIVPMIALDTRVSWIKFDDSDINLFPIEAAGILKLGMLYAGLGGGYYIFDAEPSVENNFGWFVCGGIEIALSSFGVFGEVKWTSLSADFDDVDVDLGDVPTEVKADGWGINAGVMFGIPGM